MTVTVSSCHPAALIIHILLQSRNKRLRAGFVLSHFLHTTSQRTLGTPSGLHDSAGLASLPAFDLNLNPTHGRCCTTTTCLLPASHASYLTSVVCARTLCKQTDYKWFTLPLWWKKKTTHKIINSFLLDLKLMSFETYCTAVLSLIKPLQNRCSWNNKEINGEADFCSCKISILLGWLGSEMYNLFSSTHGYPQGWNQNLFFFFFFLQS